MKFFSVFLKLMCISNNKIHTKKSNEQYNNFFNNNIPELNLNDTSGFDERFNDIDKFDDLSNINININRKRILDALINPDVATLQKIDIINKYNILDDSMKINIYGGGLLNDYNFII